MTPHSSLLKIAAAILAQPTAPFCEDAVRAELISLLALCPHVKIESDSFGNLVALYQRGSRAPQMAFAAHMDHPGFVKEPGSVPGEWGPSVFLGGVPEEYRAKNPPTRDFGRFAMWDLPGFELQGERIYSRACDDLIGCAAICEMFYELERTESEASVYGLFTRAEEVGFVGAVQLALARRVPDSVTIVSLETSSERGGACQMGDGVIIRVGDRTSIFDSTMTALFVQWARDGAIPFQRCLMSGGTCEATAYQLYGYRTAALCVALGNYHNCAPDVKIDCEFVSVRDVAAMTALCVAAAKVDTLGDPHTALRLRLEDEEEKHRRFF